MKFVSRGGFFRRSHSKTLHPDCSQTISKTPLKIRREAVVLNQMYSLKENMLYDLRVDIPTSIHVSYLSLTHEGLLGKI